MHQVNAWKEWEEAARRSMSVARASIPRLCACIRAVRPHLSLQLRLAPCAMRHLADSSCPN